LLTGCITQVQGVNQAQRLFALLDAFYRVPAGAHWRPAPFIPCLSFAPSAWTL
jgi:hypothetical protein